MKDNYVRLTVLLDKRDFETAVQYGMNILQLYAEEGLAPPGMPYPDDREVAHDVAVLGIQELIGCQTARWETERSDLNDDGDIPF